MVTHDDFLASDHDREQAVTQLATHWSAGRLDLPALDERTAAAYAATHRSQLRELLRDLPDEPEPATATLPDQPARHPRPQMPGIRRFREDVVLRKPPEAVHDQALTHIAPLLGSAGYHIAACERPRMMRFVATSSATLSRLTAVLTGALALLAFARREEQSITILCMPGPEPGSTRLIAFGEAPRSVRRAFAELHG